MKKNWKTTVLGILTILSALVSAGMALLDGNPATNLDGAALIAAITAGIGLIAAKDAEGPAPEVPPAPAPTA